VGGEQYNLDLTRVPGKRNFARPQMGWHGPSYTARWNHPSRFVCPVSLIAASLFAVELLLDANFDIRLQGGTSLFCRRSKAAVSVLPPLTLPRQRRQRFILTIRTLDAWLQGHSYRQIARRACFGKEQVMGRSWRAHDLRKPNYPPGPRTASP